jgi:hypothetical protein
VNLILIALVTKVQEENYSSGSFKIWDVISTLECCTSLYFIEKETFAANDMFILYNNVCGYD